MPQTNTASAFFTLLQDMHTKPKRILVEGDSWVSHPLLANITAQFDQFGKGNFAILNLAQPGDTAGCMLSKEGRQFKELSGLIFNEQFGYKWNFIFISAAGNDIVGKDLEKEGMLLDKREHPNLQGHQLIGQTFRDTITSVAGDYQNLIDFRNNSEANAETPIITHAYSYLIPRMVGTKVFGASLGDGWVQRYLKPKGIVDPEEQKDVVRGMLDTYYEAMISLQNNNRNFLIVDTRLTLSLTATQPKLAWWHDEIHPNYTGFKKVAEAIREKMREVDFWPK
ncbi:MAG: hypothetical protein AB1899_07360 [Pseudomonadota bacterium]